MFSCILVINDATCSEFVKITFLKVVLIVPGISQSIKKDLNYQTLADKITKCLRLILKIVFGGHLTLYLRVRKGGGGGGGVLH